MSLAAGIESSSTTRSHRDQLIEKLIQLYRVCFNKEMSAATEVHGSDVGFLLYSDEVQYRTTRALCGLRADLTYSPAPISFIEKAIQDLEFATKRNFQPFVRWSKEVEIVMSIVLSGMSTRLMNGTADAFANNERATQQQQHTSISFPSHPPLSLSAKLASMAPLAPPAGLKTAGTSSVGGASSDIERRIQQLEKVEKGDNFSRKIDASDERDKYVQAGGDPFTGDSYFRVKRRAECAFAAEDKTPPCHPLCDTLMLACEKRGFTISPEYATNTLNFKKGKLVPAFKAIIKDLQDREAVLEDSGRISFESEKAEILEDAALSISCSVPETKHYMTRDMVVHLMELDDERLKELNEKGWDSFLGKYFKYKNAEEKLHTYNSFMHEAKWRENRAKYYAGGQIMVENGTITAEKFKRGMRIFDKDKVKRFSRIFTEDNNKNKETDEDFDENEEADEEPDENEEVDEELDEYEEAEEELDENEEADEEPDEYEEADGELDEYEEVDEELDENEEADEELDVAPCSSTAVLRSNTTIVAKSEGETGDTSSSMCNLPHAERHETCHSVGGDQEKYILNAVEKANLQVLFENALREIARESTTQTTSPHEEGYGSDHEKSTQVQEQEAEASSIKDGSKKTLRGGNKGKGKEKVTETPTPLPPINPVPVPRANCHGCAGCRVKARADARRARARPTFDLPGDVPFQDNLAKMTGDMTDSQIKSLDMFMKKLSVKPDEGRVSEKKVGGGYDKTTDWQNAESAVNRGENGLVLQLLMCSMEEYMTRSDFNARDCIREAIKLTAGRRERHKFLIDKHWVMTGGKVSDRKPVGGRINAAQELRLAFPSIKTQKRAIEEIAIAGGKPELAFAFAQFREQYLDELLGKTREPYDEEEAIRFTAAVRHNIDLDLKWVGPDFVSEREQAKRAEAKAKQEAEAEAKAKQEAETKAKENKGPQGRGKQGKGKGRGRKK